MLVPKTYDILDRCVSEGIAMGYTRAFKHDSRPSEDTIKENIHREVMSEICAYFSINSGSLDHD